MSASKIIFSFSPHRMQSVRQGTLGRRRACHLLQAPRFDLELADLVFLYLAGERGREFGDEAHVLGDLVIGDLALAEVANLVLGSFDAGTQPDPGHYDLSQPGVGDAY